MWNIKALLFMNKLTLISCYIISLCLSLCFTYLLMFILAFFFIDSVALLGILSVALFFSAGDSVGHLNSVALLPGLIPAFVLPDCSAGRNTTVGTSKEKQESQHLHN